MLRGFNFGPTHFAFAQWRTRAANNKKNAKDKVRVFAKIDIYCQEVD
jgi:hypothetical protein